MKDNGRVKKTRKVVTQQEERVYNVLSEEALSSNPVKLNTSYLQLRSGVKSQNSLYIIINRLEKFGLLKKISLGENVKCGFSYLITLGYKVIKIKVTYIGYSKKRQRMKKSYHLRREWRKIES